MVTVRVRAANSAPREFQTLARIDTPEELTAFRHGGSLPTCCATRGTDAIEFSHQRPKAEGCRLLTAEVVKARALEVGFDLCGIAPVGAFPS